MTDDEAREQLLRAKRLLSDAAENPADLAFQQSAIAQAADLVGEVINNQP